MYMVSNLSKLEEINVLASEANWAWPEAVRSIFRPRGVNLLVAQSAGEFVNIIERRRIHTTIVDMDSEKSNGLATIKIIRMDYPLVPCILLSSAAGESLLCALPAPLTEKCRYYIFSQTICLIALTGYSYQPACQSR
ncbi:unnamed protein product [marine sediment metagenome]|uniref:Response regulatory domain-containing protein n=1 Tax=marine sediment metagenome TaxID=412755 RepID=X1EDR4_9ZZZZ